jgi:hypothetical protein
MYANPNVDLMRRKAIDASRTRRNFELHTAMRPYFPRWYEAVASLDPARVVWEHPANAISGVLLDLARDAIVRPSSCSTDFWRTFSPVGCEKSIIMRRWRMR